MALRLWLVALVALMSFELPTRHDLASWTENGSRWLGSRVADLSDFGTEVERAFTGLSRPETASEPTNPVDPVVEELALMRADLAFEVAMDGLLADFKGDLVATEAKLPVAAEAPVAVAIENRAPIVEPTDPVCFDPEIEVVDPVRVSSTIEVVPTAERLHSAVRLTRQALSAWASLISSTTEAEAEDSR
jgi:hypothetical protein